MIRRLVIGLAPGLGAWLSFALASCSTEPTSCIARGTTTSSTGTATYSLTSPVRPAVSWSVPASVEVYDITPGCWYSDMEFKVTVGTCSLWLRAPGDAAGPGDGGDGGLVTGEVEPGGACELPVSMGNVTIGSVYGALTMGPSLSLTLSGDVTGIDDSAVTSPEKLSWKFESGPVDYGD